MCQSTTFGGGLRRLGLILAWVIWLGGEGFAHAGAKPNPVVTSPPPVPIPRLIIAAFDGEPQQVDRLLADGLDVNARVGPGLTAWQAAQIKGHSDIMETLARHGANTNVTLPPLEAILDWYVKQKIAPDSPGLALAVIRDGGLIFTQGWGLANLEYDIPVTPSTVFHLASVSKQFTAFAIARLLQQGKISLDDDLRKYLPAMHDFGTPITLRQLLSHTSGLRNQWTLLVLAGERNGDVVTQADVLRLLENQTELNFPPGGKFEYCNSGYTLLAEVVARISGQTFAGFAQAEIFGPLGMTSTHFHTNSLEVVPNMAYCYYPSLGGGYHKNILNYETVGPTGLYATVEDLAKWIANVQHPRPGDAVPLAMMQESGRLNNGETTGYGMGLFIETYRGARLVQHGGADASYRSFVLWFPDLHLGVALASNLGSIDAREIALTAAEIYLAGQLPPLKAAVPDAHPPGISLSPSELDQFVGKYDSAYGDLTELTRVGDHLEARTDNDPAAVLTAQAGDRFALDGDWLVFQNLPSGRAMQFTNRWGERYQRINAAADPQPDLTSYAGDYWSDELETFLKIHLKDGQLVLELYRHGEFPLRSVAPNVFATTPGNWWFEVKFQRNPQNTITGLRLNSLYFRWLHLKPPTDIPTPP